MQPLTNDQIQFVKKCVSSWIVTAMNAKPDYVSRSLAHNATATVDHSSLFERLLRGETPAAEAPPRAYGYPWMNLIRNGVEENCEVHIDEEREFVLVDQSAWKLIEKISDSKYIIQWPENYPWRAQVEKMETPRHKILGWKISLLK